LYRLSEHHQGRPRRRERDAKSMSEFAHAQ
jgi:hypothetical protein